MTVRARRARLIGAGGTWLGTAMAIPGGGVGGPPTIADFDGDVLPEISAAGSGAYAVYDPGSRGVAAGVPIEFVETE